ncbi:lipase [Tritrichomonas foetus]|uniref:Lipase n=1 Tax=Tritrichomonas foetus TaxID=1144522 RepID=A0A1J4KS58_9EUKA|nr:lipase [Tritrichomonas foetus]|eukprot:OHT12502.1 lipase [Tritrichomonas foetus]
MVNMTTVLTCLELSSLAYNFTLLPTGFELIQSYESGIFKPKFFTTKRGDDLFVVIRGESTLSDIESILDFSATSFLDGNSNSGILKSARYVLGEIESLLTNHQGRVIFTGHSFGGSVAAMAATIIRLEQPKENYTLKTSAITFGTYPFISQSIAKKTRQFINGFVVNHDIFPSLNPKNIHNIFQSLVQPGTSETKKGAATLTLMLAQTVEYFMKEEEGQELTSDQKKQVAQKALEMTLAISKAIPKVSDTIWVNAGVVYHVFVEDGNKPDIAQFNENVEYGSIMEIFAGLSDHFINAYQKIMNEAQDAKYPYYR